MGKRKSPSEEGRRRLFKKRDDEVYNLGAMFNNETEEESYRRYKHRCYRNLVLKSLLAFVLGLFVAFFFRILKGV